MIVGILGKETDTGAFEAVDVCLPGMAEQDPLPHHGKYIDCAFHWSFKFDIYSFSLDTKNPKYAALLSGLNIGSDDQVDMRLQLLSEFLSGELGSNADEVSSASISRVILAGNSVSKPTKSDSKGPVSICIYTNVCI